MRSVGHVHVPDSSAGYEDLLVAPADAKLNVLRSPFVVYSQELLFTNIFHCFGKSSNPVVVLMLL